MVKGDPRLDDRPGVRWPAIYGWHFWHQLKSPSWAPKFTNKIFSITCVLNLLYFEGTGAEMDSIHIYYETRVLSVSHAMIMSQIPLIVSFYCSFIMREQWNEKYLDQQCLGWWLVAWRHQAITRAGTDLRLLASIPARFLMQSQVTRHWLTHWNLSIMANISYKALWNILY